MAGIDTESRVSAPVGNDGRRSPWVRCCLGLQGAVIDLLGLTTSRHACDDVGVAELREVVTYDGLPASAGGAHALRSKDPRTAWGQVQRFVGVAVELVSEPAVAFELWSGGPPDIVSALEAFAAEHLGGPQSRQRTRTAWRVRADAVEDVLGTVSEAGPRAVTAHGHPLASLVWSAPVALVDPATGRTYAGIGAEEFARFEVDGYGRVLGTSGVRAAIGTTGSSLSLWLAFPGDERLHGAAAHVEAHLPFRLSTKHWRRWRATRDGQSYRATKSPSPLAA